MHVIRVVHARVASYCRLRMFKNETILWLLGYVCCQCWSCLLPLGGDWVEVYALGLNNVRCWLRKKRLLKNVRELKVRTETKSQFLDTSLKLHPLWV
jgi:hypothetical protein